MSDLPGAAAARGSRWVGLFHLKSSNPWVSNGERGPSVFAQEKAHSLIKLVLPCFGLKLSHLMLIGNLDAFD